MPVCEGNRMCEELPVSFLCVTRKLQERPYEPLHPQDVAQAVGQQMSMRPPPYVAQDTLFEFYAILQGHCNVAPLQGATVDLHTLPGTTSSALPASSAEAVPKGRGGVLGSSPAPYASHDSNLPALPHVAVGDAAESYRLAQIRQNERHVNARSARVCSYFHTREGCRRGPNCPFLHVANAAPGSLPTGGR